jgi:hypothetical protein
VGSTLALAQPHYYDRLVQLASTIKFVHQEGERKREIVRGERGRKKEERKEREFFSLPRTKRQEREKESWRKGREKEEEERKKEKEKEKEGCFPLAQPYPRVIEREELCSPYL